MKISRGPLALLFAAMLAMVATDVMAQRGGGGRPGGGAPGGGGFGGPGGGFGGPSLSGLLQIKEVRDEIEVMPDQEEALKKLGEERPQFQRPDGVDFGDRSEEGRAKVEEFMAKMRTQRDEAEKKVREQLEEILLPQQMDRLGQIEIQVMGTGALSNERVAKELKLTDKQKEELKEKSESTRDEMMTKMRELFQGGGGDRDGMREKMQGLQKEMSDKLIAVLTPDQKKAFEDMKGKPFEMPQGQGRGGFGGRGGPGGAGGPGGGDRGGRGGDRGGRPAAE